MVTSENLDYLNEEIGLVISIDLMRRKLERQWESIDSIRDTTKTVFGASSIIVSLLGALQLYDANPVPQFIDRFNIGIITVAIIYVAHIIACLIVLTPINFMGPIVDDWSTLYDAFIDKSKIEILKTQLYQYLLAIQTNQPIIQRISLIARIASALLPFIIGILLLLSMVPKQ